MGCIGAAQAAIMDRYLHVIELALVIICHVRALEMFTIKVYPNQRPGKSWKVFTNYLYKYPIIIHLLN